MPNGFSNNWAYIKTELNWLERVLMVAVSRQRQERKRLDQVAQSPADRVSSHWWKGLISLDGKGYYDEHRPNTPKKSGYRQQLQSRIEATHKSGVVLALPYLCRRLQLTQFEKHLLLMGIAPEVNRRYSRLYHYLQEHSESELPTLELALRLLCRNDSDWQAARRRLSQGSPLIEQGLIQLLPSDKGTLLTASVQVRPRLVELLLAEESCHRDLEALTAPQPAASTPSPPVTWDNLVLSAPLLAALRGISDRLTAQAQAEARGLAAHYHSARLGELQLFLGEAGTGKTLATQAIATALSTVPQIYDLRYLSPGRWEAAVADLAASCPKVLLIKSPQLWFGPDAAVDGVAELLAQRQQQPVLTVLSAQALAAIAPQWRQLVTVQPFPAPQEAERLQLWKRAFPPQVSLGRLRWRCLATAPLTGKEIMALGREATLIALAESSDKFSDEASGESSGRVMQRHVSAALKRRGHRLPHRS